MKNSRTARGITATFLLTLIVALGCQKRTPVAFPHDERLQWGDGKTVLGTGTDLPEEKKLDAVLWRPGEKNQVSVLYVVLKQPKKMGHDERCRLVVNYAKAALREVKRYEGKEFNVAFFLRLGPRDGYVTGFSIEQLQEIAQAKPEWAVQLVGEHAWSIGELPREG